MKTSNLPKKQIELWKKLARVTKIADFYLAGGTALALNFNHRESIDFDFFTAKSFDNHGLAKSFSKSGNFQIDSLTENTLLGAIDGIKVSFFKYPYSSLQKPEKLEGLTVASLADLAAMKVIAISQRGARRDFVDLYFIMESGFSIGELLQLTKDKMSDLNISETHLLKSLVYFEDAILDPMPKMKVQVSWEQMTAKITKAVTNYLRG